MVSGTDLKRHAPIAEEVCNCNKGGKGGLILKEDVFQLCNSNNLWTYDSSPGYLRTLPRSMCNIRYKVCFGFCALLHFLELGILKKFLNAEPAPAHTFLVHSLAEERERKSGLNSERHSDVLLRALPFLGCQLMLGNWNSWRGTTNAISVCCFLMRSFSMTCPHLNYVSQGLCGKNTAQSPEKKVRAFCEYSARTSLSSVRIMKVLSVSSGHASLCLCSGHVCRLTACA